MKLKKIEKVHQGKFIARYDVTYRLEDGRDKVYEMISRNPNIETAEDLRNPRHDSVVLVMTDESGEHLLLNREFRMAAGDWVYNFPAGLIDGEETCEEAAARELREETGLTLLSIDDVLSHSYGAIGFSNEKSNCVYGTAGGEFHPSTSSEEEIHAGWYSRAEVRELLENKAPFSGRTQSFCYLWSKESGGDD